MKLPRSTRRLPLLHRGVLWTLFTLLVSSMTLLTPGMGAAQSTQDLWAEISEASISKTTQRFNVPLEYRALRLNVAGMSGLLDQAPLEGSLPLESSPVVVSLPLPSGGVGLFRIVDSPIMAPELAAKYPEIRTFAGIGIDDPTASMRLDMTPHGFHAIILSAAGTIYIDPYQRGDIEHYISYDKRNAVLSSGNGPVEIGIVGEDSPAAREVARLVSSGIISATGPELRTYRLALSATGEYTQFHGGTVAAALAEMTTAMNRVNGIYEREVSLRMQLVANTDQLIFTNSGTDPFTNDDGEAMLAENQTLCDNVIGNANYDIGHVFSTGGGGVAGLAVTCITGQKAEGVTGLGSPVGDPFYVDFVAHEMGHQWGANHTFNGTGGNCGAERNAATAYEPGSGSTIAAYAGICAPHDLQPNSDDYFHTASFNEIEAHSVLGLGNGCAVITPTGNAAPVPNAGTGGFAIPISTPFELTGSATDANGDVLTYCWEEFDLGPAGAPGTPAGNAPIFRSFPPVASPTRVFPRLQDLLNNSQTMGELLPSYARNLTFRLTARDNRGGVAHDQVAFTVSDAAGPFLVTSPNTAVTWMGGTTQTVTWNVAGTNGAPVNCANVDILLSVDGGLTFSTVVVANTPNDGSQMIVVPNTPTTQARIKVKATGNIFFDVSNQNFTINAGGPVCSISDLAAGAQTPCDAGSNSYSQEIVVTYSNPPAGGNLVVNGQSFAITASPQTVTLIGLNADGAPVNVTANFSAEPACSRTENALFTAPASCAPVCSITDLQAGTQTLCNPTNNTYTQEVVVFYSNPPGSGTLDVNGQSFPITVGPQLVVLTGLSADGAPVNVTASFSAQPGCSRTENALFTAPASCAPLCVISDLAAGTQTACDAGSNTYTQEVVVTYANPPASGTLDVNGQSFARTTSPQTVVLTGLGADGASVNVTASFSAQPSCSRTENNLFTAPASCGLVSACMPGQPIDIPDDDPDGITSTISFPDSLQIQEVQIFLDIEHAWIGDLIVELTHNGTTVRLHDQTGDSANDILGTYPINLTVDGPGSLSDFNGQLSNGDWTLFVSDNGFEDVGRLWDWCVDIRGNRVTTAVGPDPELPGVATLFPSHPNPSRGGETQIRFALNTGQSISLRIYDVAGRLVRSLHEGHLPAGFHASAWDGRDQRGARVHSGIYFSRLQVGSTRLTSKLMVIR